MKTKIRCHHFVVKSVLVLCLMFLCSRVMGSHSIQTLKFQNDRFHVTVEWADVLTNPLRLTSGVDITVLFKTSFKTDFWVLGEESPQNHFCFWFTSNPFLIRCLS